MRVVEAGPLATVQDLGRAGWARYGVPASGAMDWFALRAANRLVGNADDLAGLEIGLGNIVLETGADLVVAAAGAGYQLMVDGRPLPMWMSAVVRRGREVELRRRGGGCWAYLAVGGGLDCPVVLGGRATNVRGAFGGLGGRPLRAGDFLPVAGARQSPWALAGREIPEAARPAYTWPATVQVIAGPQADHFAPEGLETFFGAEFAVLPESDRMGYRLHGPAVAHAGSADIVSDGMLLGSVQVPASGQPLVMLADGPTTGGYPKIATVVMADLPLLAQCAPGEGRVRFAATSVATAHDRYRAMLAGLRVVERDTPV